ncbi:iron ABC transporter permease [Sinosporangium siamense]|uniref:Iron ABC transporter permease n=2 Tax=Sinosporangium siamense TaxID=1367973 RepID=A0A919RGP8_9ACTN|nr:iron ABC transporter permease [Sinosporangium siamense]
MRVFPRAVAVAAAVGLALLGVLLLAVCVGDYPLPIDRVLHAVFGGTGGQTYIVREFRLPRALVGALAGAALATAGAIFQSLTRNDLASPDILGVESGAGFAAVILIAFGIGGTLSVTGMALLGAVTATLVVYVLAYHRGLLGMRMILVGIGVNAVIASATTYVLMLADLHDAQMAHNWLLGSFNDRRWEHVLSLGVPVAILLPPALLQARRLRMLTLGDDVSRSLGLRVEPARFGLVAVAVLLAAVTVSIVGPVGFVALVAPHIARRLTGRPGGALFTSALVGALLAVAADLAGRTLFGAVEMPVGVITAFAGGPWLIYLLIRPGRKES